MKELRRQLIPDDETGAVLRQMLDDGDNLELARDIAFLSVFAERAQADAFIASLADVDDLLVDVPECDEDDIWQVAVIRHMPAVHAQIVALEALLTERAQAAGGYPDGWQCDAAEPEA